MSVAQDLGNGYYLYEQKVVCKSSGRFGLTARITPVGEDWNNSVPGFMCWPQ
jgi:starch phosphorylase